MPFTDLMIYFDFQPAAGELPGAALHALVFAFIHADAPHLLLEIEQPPASERFVGAWCGHRLALVAGVSATDVEGEEIADFLPLVSRARSCQAIGVVVAPKLDMGARIAFEAEGARALDRSDLLRAVGIWDPSKQRAGIDAFAYFVRRHARDPALLSRFVEYQQEAAERLEEMRAPGGYVPF